MEKVWAQEGQPSSNCPNGEAILAHARKVGVVAPCLRYSPLYGWLLQGTGRSRVKGNGFPQPAVWQVAQDCNVCTGGGSCDEIQIAPQNFREPAASSVVGQRLSASAVRPRG